MLMVEHEGPEREGLPQNPQSPQDAIFVSPEKIQSPDISIASEDVAPDISAPQTVGTNFTGATLADTGAFPPDSMGTVGPTQFVVAVNGRIRSFNKTTGAADGVLNADTDVFFAPAMTPLSGGVTLNFTSDPRIRYDRLSGRWFVIMIDVPSSSPSAIGDKPNRIMLAVSDAASNGTITGSTVWTYYYFQNDLVSPAGNPGGFADYPTLGVDANALYIGTNDFSSTGSFAGTSAFVVRKSSVTGAGPIVVSAFRNLTGSTTGAGPYTPQGVDNFDPAATEGYFIGVDNATFGTLMLRRITSPGGTPTISANIAIAVNTTQFPGTVPHSGNTGGTNGKLDALDDRLFAATMRNGQIWTAHNIGVNASGTATSGAARRAAVRWYRLGNIASPSTPNVVESGTIFDSAGSNPVHHWIPSIMVSGQGHAAVGYSTAGNNNFANAATSGRLSGDAAGTTRAEVNYTNTSSSYNPPSDPGGAAGRRWGDYSYTSLDPLDDMTMWTIQEFCDASNSYGVRVAKLAAPPPATPASASTTVNAGLSSVSVTITGTSASGSGFFDPGANLAAPALPFNHISATVSGGVTVNSVTYTDPTHVTLDLNTTGATAGTKNVTITNPDGQSATGNGILTVNAPTYSISGQITGSCGTCNGITVNLSGSSSASATTSGGGNYTFAGLAGGGNYTVTPSGAYLFTPNNLPFSALAANQTGANFTAGTIPPINAGDLIISEFRLRGPSSATDEFIEIYNSTSNPINVQVSDGSLGFTVVASDGIPRFTIPNGTVIPAFGHYLGVNSSGYSLGSYATGDQTYTVDIADDAGVALFKTSNPVNFTLANRLDAVGSTTVANTLYREGTGYPAIGAVGAEGSFYRDAISGSPKDTNDNAADFIYANTAGSSTAAGQRLGAPGPENLSSPAIRNGMLTAGYVDPAVAITASPNRVRNTASYTDSLSGTGTYTAGTLAIRRTYTNNTGVPITRLRFRIVDITGFPAAAGVADLRAITSPNVTATITGGGTVNVIGTTLENSAVQPNGGGLNSSLSVGTITLGTPLNNGQTVAIQWLLGVKQIGTFRFYVNFEALP
jgi:hypothetical protein